MLNKLAYWIVFIELSLLNLGTYLLFCLNHSTVIHVLVVYYANCLSRKTILRREGQRIRLAMSLSSVIRQPNSFLYTKNK